MTQKSKTTEKLTSKAVVTDETTVKAKAKYEEVEETFDNLDDAFIDDLIGAYDEVYFVKAKTKDLAYFEFRKKVGNVISVDPRKTICTIDGEVEKMEMGEYTYENKEIKTLKIHLKKRIKEKTVLFILNLSYTQTTRSIINSLLACNKPITRLCIVLYKNAAGFSSVKMTINGERAEWKYSIEEMKKHIDKIVNKKGEFISNDYSELDELFFSALRKHLPVIQPGKDHVKITDDPKEPNDEAIFGEREKDDASEFFEIDTDN